MNWFFRLFSRRGRVDALLKRAVMRSSGDLPGAIVDYTAVTEMEGDPHDLKAMAHFNRGLAYSQTQQMDLAMKDFQKVLSMPGVPANVTSAAKERLERLRRRAERGATTPPDVEAGEGP